MNAIVRKFNDSELLSCAVAGRVSQESVVICDAQKRATGYAYLVMNTAGDLYVAWVNKSVGLFDADLVCVTLTINAANIDVAARRFAQQGYVVG